MFNKDSWAEIFNTIRKNKLRSFLTAFGVFWGIFILILILGSSRGFRLGIMKNFEGFAVNSLFMWSQNTSVAYKGFNKNRSWELKNADIEAIKKTFSEVKTIAPRLDGWKAAQGENVVRGEKSGAFRVYGDYPEFFEISPMDIKFGRPLNQYDLKNSRKVCLIGERIYEELFEKGEDPFGEYIRISGVYFKVIGVLYPKTEIRLGGDPKNMIFMPFTTLQKTFAYGDIVHWFCLIANDHISVENLEKDIAKLLKRRHQISPKDEQAVGGFNMQDEFRKINGTFSGIDVLAWVVGIGTLLAGIIGVSNIMLITVKERTKEIGIKRALGATPWMIRKQIFIESIILTVIAGFIGVFISVLLLEISNIILIEALKDSFIKFQPGIDLKMALMALVILIVCGSLAGMIPANRAVRIKPIDALRDE